MAKDKEMPFWDHLEELRWCMIKSIFAIIIFTIFIYMNWNFFLEFLLEPSKSLNLNLNLQVLKITSMFVIKISCSILLGIVFSLPIISYQIWNFINPALSQSFRLSVLFLSSFGSIFFLVGLCFGYFVL